MKKTLIASLSLCFTLLLTSCVQKSFADTSTCSEIGAIIEAAVNDGQEYIAHDTAHISLYFDDTDEYDDHFTAYSANTSDINEFGVFHAPNENAAAELYEEVRDYVSDMQEEQRAFIKSYAPSELTKLDSAKVKRFGNYVVYTVLDRDTSNKVIGELEKYLSE